MHFIHLFSILLPVCFNKFSVQCSVYIKVPKTSEIVEGQEDHRACSGSLGITNEFMTTKHKKMPHERSYVLDARSLVIKVSPVFHYLLKHI